MNITGRKPPLIMHHHFFPSVHIEANSTILKEKTSEDKKFGCEFGLELEVGPQEKDIYPIALAIKSRPSDGKVMAYTIKLLAVGYFSIDSDIPSQKIESILAITGGSMLYGAAREFIYSVTMRGPFPPVYLPTVSFIPEQKSSDPSQHRGEDNSSTSAGGHAK